MEVNSNRATELAAATGLENMCCTTYKKGRAANGKILTASIMTSIYGSSVSAKVFIR